MKRRKVKPALRNNIVTSAGGCAYKSPSGCSLGSFAGRFWREKRREKAE